MIFLDLKKAFDTVSHDMLINKLDHYGIREIANNLFKCYLTGREQHVVVNGSSSTSKSIQFGVPQESNLGPYAEISLVA